jgi:hypothetical protein
MAQNYLTIIEIINRAIYVPQMEGLMRPLLTA